jgi:hypothetical protein
LAGFGGGDVVGTLWAPPFAFAALFGFAGAPAAFAARGFLAAWPSVSTLATIS